MSLVAVSDGHVRIMERNNFRPGEWYRGPHFKASLGGRKDKLGVLD